MAVTRAIQERHHLNSPALFDIAESKRNRRPYLIDGKAYEMDQWHKEPNSVLVTFVPFGESKYVKTSN